MSKGKQQRRTRHHVIPRERIKKRTYPINQTGLHIDAVVKLWSEKHIAWHTLFKNMTLDEIIECLHRLRRALLHTQKPKGAKIIPMKDSFFFEKPRA